MAKLTNEDLLELSRLHHEISVILLRVANTAGDEEMKFEVISDYQEIAKVYSLDKSTEDGSTGIMMQEMLEEEIVSILKELSIPTNVKGYRYLRDAIKLAIFNRSILKQITKKLYPEIAEMNEDKPLCVERAIRHAIEVAWRKNNIEIVEKYFGNTISKSKRKPTNSEFMATITDYVSLKIKKY